MAGHLLQCHLLKRTPFLQKKASAPLSKLNCPGFYTVTQIHKNQESIGKSNYIDNYAAVQICAFLFSHLRVLKQ